MCATASCQWQKSCHEIAAAEGSQQQLKRHEATVGKPAYASNNNKVASTSRKTSNNKTHATPRLQATARTPHVNRMLSAGENPRDAET